MSKRILVLPGDGIGPEIVAEAVKVLDRLAGEGLDIEMDEGLVGGAAYDAAGDPLPEETLEAARASDARLAHALERARPGDVADGRVELSVSRDDVLAVSTLERREAMLSFRRVTQQVLGVPLAPKVCVDETQAPARPTRAESAVEHPTVRRVREVTGGRLLDVQDGRGEASASDEESS